jgi:hypothetical protein
MERDRVVNGLNDEYISQLGATLVALLQRGQVAEKEGLLVEVLEIEGALASLRAELALVAEQRRGGRGPAL